MSAEFTESYTQEAPFEMSGERLDIVLASLFPDYSRARLQRWIKDGAVQIDGVVKTKQKDKLYGGEVISLQVVLEPEGEWLPEQMPLEICYEDDAILVVNKPINLVVHPAAGNRTGTLLNGLIHYDPKLIQVPRAGIVHRLDKDTSGLMVVARTLQAQTALVEQLQARSVKREYEAVVVGSLTGGGQVNQPIGRHAVDRKRMAVNRAGREAITHYRLLERFRSHCHIRLQLETGRTHQIRVHMSHLRHPLVGDSVYGGRLRIPSGCSEALQELLRGYGHQSLHAIQLGLEHPVTGESMSWQSERPADMEQLLAQLRHDRDAADAH
jgi:23S rRNA pseudouridine1911/1915/1917 synthase